MKKLFTLALAFFLGLSSCTNDEVKLEPSFEEKLLAKVKFDNEVSIANKEKFTTNLQKIKPIIASIVDDINLEQINSQEIYSINTRDNSNARFVTFNFKSSKYASISYTLSHYKNVNNEYKTVLTKTDKDLKLVFYYFLEDREFVSIDIENKGANFEKLITHNTGMRSAGWGQRTADCIVDAYSNYGWASVAAILVTGYMPGVGVAIAAVCAYNQY